MRLLLVLAILVSLRLEVVAQPGKHEDPLSWDRHISGLVQKYCYRCHNEEKKHGDVNLAQDEHPRLILQNRKTWLTALAQIEEGAMPPDDAKQPSDEDRQKLITFLKQTVLDLDCTQIKDPGRPTVRRLNRFEYNRAIRELVGIDLQLADRFPPDATSYGFENIAESLTLTPVQVEQYHEAAREVLTAVMDQRDAHREAYARVFWQQPGNGVSERDAAQKVIERFGGRAFRRPLDPALLERLMQVYDQSRSKGESHEAGVRHLLTAILISPRFLMRIERADPEQTEAYPVDDYDLATRLSFFLWSGPPDDRLLSLATQQKLSEDEGVYRDEIRRMIGDDRIDGLIDQFFGQWLQLRNAATHRPDQATFPEFDEGLRAAMLDEWRLVIRDLLREDRPLTELIATDFTYVNGPLAKLYGLSDVEGPAMRRIALTDGRRGGILTTAACLMAQSDPTRTNIPRRGNYIAGAILGVPPPPPPPNVPPLEDASKGKATLTMREMLDLHRAKPECASCHAKIDPLGFGLQNFDAIGRWRDTEQGQPVDAIGVLPEGESFSGPVELKQILLDRKDAVARVFVEQMLIYALGRGLQDTDECVVRDILQHARDHDYRCAAVIEAVANSFPFRNRRNPDY